MSISIEQKMNKVSKLDTNIWMRQCIVRFLERVNLDERYINLVLEIHQNRKTIELANIFKSIRNGGIKNG